MKWMVLVSADGTAVLFEKFFNFNGCGHSLLQYVGILGPSAEVVGGCCWVGVVVDGWRAPCLPATAAVDFGVFQYPEVMRFSLII